MAMVQYAAARIPVDSRADVSEDMRSSAEAGLQASIANTLLGGYALSRLQRLLCSSSAVVHGDMELQDLIPV